MQFLFRLKYVLLFIIIRHARVLLAVQVCGNIGIFLVNTAMETGENQILKDRITFYDIFEIDSNLLIYVSLHSHSRRSRSWRGKSCGGGKGGRG